MRENKERSLGLMGQGRIYQNVLRFGESMYQIIPLTTASTLQQLATCKAIVYCSDIWSPSTLLEINRRCLQADVALLPVYTQFGEGIIGPCVTPHQKGCASCAELRKLGATSSEADRELLYQYLSLEQSFLRENGSEHPLKTDPKKHEPLVSQPWLSSFSREMLTALVGEEIATYLHSPDQIRTDCALLSVSLETLECRRHSFLPFPSCPACGELSKDRAELAVMALQSRPKLDVFTYRIQQPVANTEQLLSKYVDQRTGLVSSLIVENTNFLPIASSQLSSEEDFFAGDGGPHPFRRDSAESSHRAEPPKGTGCTLLSKQSKVVSVLEVIERYAGLRPRSKRTMVQASYHQLIQQGQQALDPTGLGLHSPEQYEYYQQNHFCRHLTSYHPDLKCNWVWGYSFQNQSPILVPEHCAYYGVPTSEENPAFVFDISNGCALGNCLEEAIFHGIMEVVERDAFLLTWYAQLEVPRLDLLSVTDPTPRLLIRHIEYHSGYTLHAFNATLDHAIPCLYLLGVDEQNREGMPKAFVAAGSHPHPEQALLRALRELAMFLSFPRHLDQQSRTQAREMLADSSLVRRMDHHPLVYCLPEAFARLHFLYHTPRQQTFPEAFCDFSHHLSEHTDLRDDLEYLINYYLKRGTDIIAVDQTAPEHLPCGLNCVKILMPGMLPMTFGEHNRRVRGLERLYQLPFTLGYRDHPLTEAEINPHPHPFF